MSNDSNIICDVWSSIGRAVQRGEMKMGNGACVIASPSTPFCSSTVVCLGLHTHFNHKSFRTLQGTYMHNTYPSIRSPVTFIHKTFFVCLSVCIGISPSDFAGTNEFQARLFLKFIVLLTKQGERSKQFLLLQEEKPTRVELWTNRRRLEHLYHKKWHQGYGVSLGQTRSQAKRQWNL
jgi:hypothetical protein